MSGVGRGVDQIVQPVLPNPSTGKELDERQQVLQGSIKVWALQQDAASNGGVDFFLHASLEL